MIVLSFQLILACTTKTSNQPRINLENNLNGFPYQGQSIDSGNSALKVELCGRLYSYRNSECMGLLNIKIN